MGALGHVQPTLAARIGAIGHAVVADARSARAAPEHEAALVGAVRAARRLLDDDREDPVAKAGALRLALGAGFLLALMRRRWLAGET